MRDFLKLSHFTPVAVRLEHAKPDSHIAIFTCACLAVLPLAGWMGRATGHLAERTGEGVQPDVHLILGIVFYFLPETAHP